MSRPPTPRAKQGSSKEFPATEDPSSTRQASSNGLGLSNNNNPPSSPSSPSKSTLPNPIHTTVSPTLSHASSSSSLSALPSQPLPTHMHHSTGLPTLYPTAHARSRSGHDPRPAERSAPSSSSSPILSSSPAPTTPIISSSPISSNSSNYSSLPSAPILPSSSPSSSSSSSSSPSTGAQTLPSRTSTPPAFMAKANGRQRATPAPPQLSRHDLGPLDQNTGSSPSDQHPDPFDASSSSLSAHSSSPSASPNDLTPPTAAPMQPLTHRHTSSSSLNPSVDHRSSLSHSSTIPSISASSSLAGQLEQAASWSASVKKRNADFHALFPSIPPREALLEDYGCALQREILLQGRLYITERHICFHANIFGWVTDEVIPFNDLQGLEKRNTAFVIPNALLFITPSATHFITSFLFRDSAFTDIVDAWKRSRAVAAAVAATTGGVPSAATDLAPLIEDSQGTYLRTYWEEHDGLVGGRRRSRAVGISESDQAKLGASGATKPTSANQEGGHGEEEEGEEEGEEEDEEEEGNEEDEEEEEDDFTGSEDDETGSDYTDTDEDDKDEEDEEDEELINTPLEGMATGPQNGYLDIKDPAKTNAPISVRTDGSIPTSLSSAPSQSSQSSTGGGPVSTIKKAALSAFSGGNSRSNQAHRHRLAAPQPIQFKKSFSDTEYSGGEDELGATEGEEGSTSKEGEETGEEDGMGRKGSLRRGLLPLHIRARHRKSSSNDWGMTGSKRNDVKSSVPSLSLSTNSQHHHRSSSTNSNHQESGSGGNSVNGSRSSSPAPQHQGSQRSPPRHHPNGAHRPASPLASPGPEHTQSSPLVKANGAPPAAPLASAPHKGGGPDASSQGNTAASLDLKASTTPGQCDCGDAHGKDVVCLDTTLPGTFTQLTGLLFSLGPEKDSGAWLRSFYSQDQKCREVKLGEWKAPEDPGSKAIQERSIEYIRPLNNAIGPKQTQTLQVDRCITYRTGERGGAAGGALTILSEVRTPDVPSGNAFVVGTRVCLTQGSVVGEVRMRAGYSITWNKSSWIKGAIEKGALEGNKANFSALDRAIRHTLKEASIPGKGKKASKKEVKKKGHGESTSRMRARANGSKGGEREEGEEEEEARARRRRRAARKRRLKEEENGDGPSGKGHRSKRHGEDSNGDQRATGLLGGAWPWSLLSPASFLVASVVLVCLLTNIWCWRRIIQLHEEVSVGSKATAPLNLANSNSLPPPPSPSSHMMTDWVEVDKDTSEQESVQNIYLRMQALEAEVDEMVQGLAHTEERLSLVVGALRLERQSLDRIVQHQKGRTTKQKEEL